MSETNWSKGKATNFGLPLDGISPNFLSLLLGIRGSDLLGSFSLAIWIEISQVLEKKAGFPPSQL